MEDMGVPRMAKSHDVHLDSGYVHWIHEIKQRFRNVQIMAAVKVNSEQLCFNWQLGRDLVTRKAEETWGSGIVEQISLDLRNEFPGVKGFSTTNLWYMKKWYLFYARGNTAETAGLIRDMTSCLSASQQKLHQLGGEIELPEHNPSGGEMAFPVFFGFVPWRHHVEIITNCESVEEALFYVWHTIEEGWSRSALLNQIRSDLYRKSGKAITNFSARLAGNQGRLAQEITKDTYDLGFISLPPDYDEAALEDALEQNITRFLLELGTGFAFVGRQKEIIVAGKTRKIDMLFYHIRLKCYVVLELKVTSFEPEYVGKLNFYVNAVDELLKDSQDNPTLGLLICRDKDNVIKLSSWVTSFYGGVTQIFIFSCFTKAFKCRLNISAEYTSSFISLDTILSRRRLCNDSSAVYSPEQRILTFHSVAPLSPVIVVMP